MPNRERPLYSREGIKREGRPAAGEGTDNSDFDAGNVV